MIVEPAPAPICNGLIEGIDLPNRTLALRLASGMCVEMIVAPGCQVILNGEEVRLRLLLTGDEVEVAYFESDKLRKAVRISVLSGRRPR